MPLPPTGPQPGDAPWDPSTATSSPSPSSPPPPLLSGSQLSWCGSVLLRLLFDMKHNGAVEKTSLALAVVTERLLRAPCHDLNVLPRPWLEVRGGRLAVHPQTLHPQTLHLCIVHTVTLTLHPPWPGYVVGCGMRDWQLHPARSLFRLD